MDTPQKWLEPVDAYLVRLRARRQSVESVKLRRAQINRFARAFSDVSPWEVTDVQVDSFFAERSWQQETYRSQHSALKCFYRWAVASGRTSVNPVTLPSAKPSVPHPAPAPVSVVVAAMDTAAPRVKLMILLEVMLGLRNCEVAVLHSGDILCPTDGSFTLLVHGKGGKERLVPLPGWLAVRLLDWAAHVGGGYLFEGRVNGHLHARRVRELVNAQLSGKVTAHQLRSRFATDIYQLTLDLTITQKLLGHASVETTMRYVQTDDDKLCQAVAGHAAAWQMRLCSPSEVVRTPGVAHVQGYGVQHNSFQPLEERR